MLWVSIQISGSRRHELVINRMRSLACNQTAAYILLCPDMRAGAICLMVLGGSAGTMYDLEPGNSGCDSPGHKPCGS